MKSRESEQKKTFLELGWRVNSALEPRYWVGETPIFGRHSPDDLTRAPGSAIANHTAIIAQSGSGKSFFLGRLIEEIVVRTKARCIIIDPNSDFRFSRKIDEKVWQHPTYNRQKRCGKLTHEALSEFKKLWPANEIRVRGSLYTSERGYERLTLPLTSIDAEFLAEELESNKRSDLGHCHQTIRNLENLEKLRIIFEDDAADKFLDKCTHLFAQLRSSSQKSEGEAKLLEHVESEFDFLKRFRRENWQKGITKATVDKSWAALELGAYEPLGIPLNAGLEIVKVMAQNWANSVVTMFQYISEDVEHFYFSKVYEFQTSGILTSSVSVTESSDNKLYRIDVLDIPSLKNKAARLLATSTVLGTEWAHARQAWGRALTEPAEMDARVPTFIIVDEAHNLIPAETRTKTEGALREQFRTIVAEGRKYGLFLILVSQRPDKLDELVLSACENRAVMRLGSKAVLQITQRICGLDEVGSKLLDKCLEFETGRVLLVGPWSPDGPQLSFGAARRTVEGGRNLREEYWAGTMTAIEGGERRAKLKKRRKKRKGANSKR